MEGGISPSYKHNLTFSLILLFHLDLGVQELVQVAQD
jgi:hypothetical protein